MALGWVARGAWPLPPACSCRLAKYAIESQRELPTLPASCMHLATPTCIVHHHSAPHATLLQRTVRR